MKLEQFLLSELKDMFIYVKVKYSILCNYKIYQQNKNDVIIIMRNTQIIAFGKLSLLHCIS